MEPDLELPTVMLYLITWSYLIPTRNLNGAKETLSQLLVAKMPNGPLELNQALMKLNSLLVIQKLLLDTIYKLMVNPYLVDS